MSNICPRYAQDIPKISPRYAQDKPRICPRYAKDMISKQIAYNNQWFNKNTLLIHDKIPKVCDINIYKRLRSGRVSVGDTTVGRVSVGDVVQKWDPGLPRARIKKLKKTRYQRNVKIFIFTFLCLLIGLTEPKLLATKGVIMVTRTSCKNGILTIYPRNSQNMHKICPRYAQDMPKICPRYAQDMPKISPRYAHDIPKIWFPKNCIE